MEHNGLSVRLVVMRERMTSDLRFDLVVDGERVATDSISDCELAASWAYPPGIECLKAALMRLESASGVPFEKLATLVMREPVLVRALSPQPTPRAEPKVEDVPNSLDDDLGWWQSVFKQLREAMQRSAKLPRASIHSWDEGEK